MKIHKWHRIVTLSALVLAVTIAGATSAAAGQEGWEVRVQGVYVNPSVSHRAYTSTGAPIDISSDSDTGFAIGFGHRISDHIGWEIGAFQASPTMKLTTDFGLGGQTWTFSRDLRTRAVTAALDFHLTPNRTVDLYLSPMIASISYGSLDYTIGIPDDTTQTLNVDIGRDFGWGLGLGMDVPIGRGAWRATGSIRYLDSELDVTEVDGDFRDTINFDLTVVSLGITYRF